MWFSLNHYSPTLVRNLGLLVRGILHIWWNIYRIPVLKEDITQILEICQNLVSPFMSENNSKSQVREEKILFLFIFTCASSVHPHSWQDYRPQWAPWGHRWQTAGCPLSDGSLLTEQGLGVSWFCCVWEPPEPFNVEYFIWVIFVHLRFHSIPRALPSTP